VIQWYDESMLTEEKRGGERMGGEGLRHNKKRKHQWKARNRKKWGHIVGGILYGTKGKKGGQKKKGEKKPEKRGRKRWKGRTIWKKTRVQMKSGEGGTQLWASAGKPKVQKKKKEGGRSSSDGGGGDKLESFPQGRGGRKKKFPRGGRTKKKNTNEWFFKKNCGVGGDFVKKGGKKV